MSYLPEITETLEQFAGSVGLPRRVLYRPTSAPPGSIATASVKGRSDARRDLPGIASVQVQATMASKSSIGELSPMFPQAHNAVKVAAVVGQEKTPVVGGVNGFRKEHKPMYSIPVLPI